MSAPMRRARAYDARRWCDEGVEVEAFSGADSDHVMHRGVAIGYMEHPTVVIQEPGGRLVHWALGLCRKASEQPQCQRLVHEDGDTSVPFYCRRSLNHYGDCAPNGDAS